MAKSDDLEFIYIAKAIYYGFLGSDLPIKGLVLPELYIRGYYSFPFSYSLLVYDIQT